LVTTSGKERKFSRLNAVHAPRNETKRVVKKKKGKREQRGRNAGGTAREEGGGCSPGRLLTREDNRGTQRGAPCC